MQPRYLWILATSLTVSLVSQAWEATATDLQNNHQESTTEIQPQALKRMIDTGKVIIIDLRDREDFERDTIPCICQFCVGLAYFGKLFTHRFTHSIQAEGIPDQPKTSAAPRE